MNEWRTAARFGDGGWRLVFTLPARGDRGSYSLVLRPDFTLTLHELIFGDFEVVEALTLRPEGGMEPCTVS